jgi:Holliday junction resolvase RusA-like endonuclease
MANEIKENYIKLVLDQDVINKYNRYYFLKHPKAKNPPIEHPYHPSINSWIILPRIQMNALKQKWKDFVVFWMKLERLDNRQLDNFDIVLTVYFNTKRRHDVDNQVPKFILDGFTESGFIVDDDEKHLHSLTLKTGYDKENPRTEIEIFIHK